jgi:uncharacterized protein YoxC
MLTLKSIKTLSWAKRRRIDTLNAAVVECAKAVRERADAVTLAEQRENASEEGVTRGHDAFEQVMTAACFQPEKILVLKHILEDLRVAAAAASAHTADMRGHHASAVSELDSARQKLQRAELQIDHLEERRTELLRDIDAMQEDTQDEESEEAAVSRMVTRRSESARAMHAQKRQ